LYAEARRRIADWEFSADVGGHPIISDPCVWRERVSRAPFPREYATVHNFRDEHGSTTSGAVLLAGSGQCDPLAGYIPGSERLVAYPLSESSSRRSLSHPTRAKCFVMNIVGRPTDFDLACLFLYFLCPMSAHDPRCPYCVEDDSFRILTPAGDLFRCQTCGHMLWPSNPTFQCECGKCQDIRSDS